MVLPQDEYQRSQSQRIADKRQYDIDLEKYNQEEAEYQKQKAELERQQAEQQAKQQAEDERIKNEQEAKRIQFEANEETIRKAVAQYRASLKVGDGSTKNRKTNEYEFMLRGGSKQEWADIIAQQERDRRNSQRASAGLRAQGNSQIQQSQQTELQRLGSTGEKNTQGPSKISNTLVTGFDNVKRPIPVAEGISKPAQPDFQRGYTVESKSQGFVANQDRVGDKRQPISETIPIYDPLSGRTIPGKQGTKTPPTQFEIRRDKVISDNKKNGIMLKSFGITSKTTTNQPLTTIDKIGSSSNPIQSKQPDKNLLAFYLREGSQTNPIKGKQPDKRLVSPYLLNYKMKKPSSIMGGIETKSNEKIIGFTSLTGSYLVEQTPTRITQKNMPYGPTQQNKDPLSSATDYLTDFTKRKKDFVSQLFGGLAKEGLSGFIGGVQLEQFGGQLFVEAVRGKKQLGVRQSFESPKTLSGEALTPTFEGIVKGAMSGQPVLVAEGFKKGISQAYALSKEQSLAESFGQGIGFVVPIGTGKLSKAIPLRTESFKIVNEAGQVKTVARTLDVGFGSKTKTLVSKTDAGLNIGSPLKNIEKSSLKDISATSKNLELTTQGKLGTKILTSPEGLNVLRSEGKLLERDVKAVGLAKELSGYVDLSSKKVSNEIRQKTQFLSSNPVSSVKIGAETTALTEDVLPTLPPIKGTEAEVIQLDLDLLIPPAKPINPLIQVAQKAQTPLKIGQQDFLYGRGGGRPIQPDLRNELRNLQTSDIDVDFGAGRIARYKAGKAGDRAIKSISKVAEKDRIFFKQGTNVFVETKGKNDTKEILNILTDRDNDRGGYMNVNELKPFGIDLGRKIVKVKPSETSSKKIKFITIEQQALNRIESVISLTGPTVEKFRGKTSEIPYLSEAYKATGPQKTKSGYSVLPLPHRLKDTAKLISQDTIQIGRNLELAGFKKEGKRVKEIATEFKSLYPEIDFDKIGIDKEIGFANYPSNLSRVGSSISKNKEYVNPLLVSSPKTEIKEDIPISKPSLINTVRIQKLEIPSISKATYSKPSKVKYSSPQRISGSSVSASIAKSISKPAYSRPSKSSPSKSSPSFSSPSFSSPSFPSISVPSFPSMSTPDYPNVSPPSSPPIKSPPRLSPPSPPRLSPPRITTNIPPIFTTRTPPIIKIPFLDFEGFKKKRKSEYKQDLSFLGHSSEYQVEGLYRRSEITHGLRKIEKLSKRDRTYVLGKNKINFKNNSKVLKFSKQKALKF